MSEEGNNYMEEHDRLYRATGKIFMSGKDYLTTAEKVPARFARGKVMIEVLYASSQNGRDYFHLRMYLCKEHDIIETIRATVAFAVYESLVDELGESVVKSLVWRERPAEMKFHGARKEED